MTLTDVIADNPTRIGGIDASVSISGELSAEQRVKLQKIAAACKVSDSLKHPMRISVSLDPPAVWFVSQDRNTQQAWSVTPSAWGDASLVYRVAHGQGTTLIVHRRGDLEVRTTWCVDSLTSVKQVRLRMVNRGQRTLRLRLTGPAAGELLRDRAGASARLCATAHRRQTMRHLPLTRQPVDPLHTLVTHCRQPRSLPWPASRNTTQSLYRRHSIPGN